MEPDNIALLPTWVITYLKSLTLTDIALPLLGLCWIYAYVSDKKYPMVAGAPVHGYRSNYEPSFLLKNRTYTGFYDILSSGYKIVCEILSNGGRC